MKKQINKLILIVTGIFFFCNSSYGVDITLTSTQTIAAGIAAGAGTNTDVVVIIPENYTGSTIGTTNDLTSIPSTIQNLTIQGVGTSTNLYLRQINLPARTLASFKLRNLSISAFNENTATPPYNLLYYVLSPSNAANVTNLTFENCKIANFRGVIRLNNGTASTFNNIKFNGCVIRNIHDFNMVYLSGSNVVNTVSIQNSSIYGLSGRLLYLVPTTTSNLTSVAVNHCTIDTYSGGGSAYIADLTNGTVTNTTTSIAVTNCLLGKTTSTYGIRGGATPVYLNNYKTKDWALTTVDATPVDKTVTEMFVSPSTYNYVASSSITCSTVSGSTAVTLSSASSNVYVGQSISGTGIAANTTVSAISGTNITISAAATATNSAISLTLGVGTASMSGDYTIKDDGFTGKSRVGNPTCYYSLTGIFRSVHSGNWSESSTWEYSLDGGSSWTTPNAAPSISSGSVTILNGHAVTVDVNSSAPVLTIDAGGQLTINPGLTLFASSLLLVSNTSGTGTLINNSTDGLIVLGTTTANQYLPDARNWYVASPVSTSNVPASGFTLYNYNEVNNSWDTPASFTKGVGYVALPGSAGSTLAFSGTLNTGDIDVVLTKSGTTGYQGYNLIGNPYPAHLTWTQTFVDNNTAKIEPTIWYRTNAGTTNASGQWTYKTYNAHSGEASPLGTTGIIPPMQGFWVKAVAAGTLTLNSDLTKSHQLFNPLKSRTTVATDRQRLRLEVSNGTLADETLLYFDAAAANGYDSYDSPKITGNVNSVPELYTTVAGQKLVMNGMNTITDDVELPLGFTPGQAGGFTIKAVQLSNFGENTQVILKDNLEGKSILLSEGTDYAFNSEAISSTGRFSILFRSVSETTKVNDITNDAIAIYNDTKNRIVVLLGQSVESATAGIYSLSGQKLYIQSLVNSKTVLKPVLTAGTYLVKVASGSGCTTQKIIIK